MKDFSDEIASLRTRHSEAQSYLKIAELRTEQPELEHAASEPGLWDDSDRAKEVTGRLSSVNEDLDLFDSLESKVDDIATLYEMAREEDDESLVAEIDLAIAETRETFSELEIRSMFTGEFDELDAVCHIQAGEGGTDSQDWAEMLLRMYIRWADKRGLDLEIQALSEGQEAGLSSVEFLVKGRYAYGLLRSEHGVHRLVRISPFNKEGKRQTAFCSLHAVPYFDDVSSEIVIDESELRIDTYRSSGAGGQHINVTDSAVRITHLPTGTVVSCQNERSQHQNKDQAMKALTSKLFDLERQKRDDDLAEIAGEAKRVGFGSQIRSYVLQPYQLVKDLRSQHETGNVSGVLGGDIEPFMEQYLQWQRAEGLDQ